jgi:hypothetical protein
VSDATADTRNTAVRLSQPGTYTLRLSAYDGAATVSDDVTVTVP